MHTHIYIYKYVCKFEGACIYIYIVYTCTCTCTNMQISVHIYICIYMDMSTHIFVSSSSVPSRLSGIQDYPKHTSQFCSRRMEHAPLGAWASCPVNTLWSWSATSLKMLKNSNGPGNCESLTRGFPKLGRAFNVSSALGSLAPQAQGLKLGNESEKPSRSWQQVAVSCDPSPPKGFGSLFAKGKLFKLQVYKCTSAFGPNFILAQAREERNAISARIPCTPEDLRGLSPQLEVGISRKSRIPHGQYRAFNVLGSLSPQSLELRSELVKSCTPWLQLCHD